MCEVSTMNQQAEIIAAGVDIGSISSQAVIMIDGEIFAYSKLQIGQIALTAPRKR